MKQINPTSPLTLGLVAIVFGIILFIFGKRVLEFSIILTGIILVIIAIVQQIATTKAEQNQTKSVWKTTSLTAVAILTIGVILITFPVFWVRFAMTLVGLVILLLAVAYIMQIIQTKKAGYHTSAFHYILFVILVAASILILTEPSYIADFIMQLTGGIYILCGVLELSNYFTLKKLQKRLDK